MVDEGTCNGDHAGVRLPLITDRTMLSVHVYAFQDLGDAKFMRSIWQRHDALAADGNTSSTSGAGVFTLFVSTLQRLVTSHFSLLGVSAQIQAVVLPPSDSRCPIPIVTVWTAPRGCIGMMGTEAGLGV